MRNRLLNLYANNAKRGEFKAEGNTLYIYDAIVSSKAEADWFGGVDAETFVKALAGMTGDVSVRINSPGGDVFAGVAMASAINAYPGKVSVSVDGYAASAASVVAIAGDSIEMAPGSFMMIHKAWTLSLGNADDMMATASLLEKIDGSLAEGYATSAAKRGSKMTAAEFTAAMAAETWMAPQDAIDAGLADSIAAAPVKASAAWDLSAYEKAPQAAEIDNTTVTITVEIEETPEPADPTDPAMPDASAEYQIAARIRAHEARMLLIPA